MNLIVRKQNRKCTRGSLSRIYTVPFCCTCGFKCCPASVVRGSALSDLSKSPLLHIFHLVPPLEPKRGRNENQFNTSRICTSHQCEPLMRRYITGPYLARSLGSIRFLFCRLLKRSLRTLPSGCGVVTLHEGKSK